MNRKEIPMGWRSKIEEEKKDRLIVKGVFPTDKSEKKESHLFWCSKYLKEQYPCECDLVSVKYNIIRTNGEPGILTTVIYVTDVYEWSADIEEPKENDIARFLYRGKNHRDFEYEE